MRNDCMSVYCCAGGLEIAGQDSGTAHRTVLQAGCFELTVKVIEAQDLEPHEKAGMLRDRLRRARSESEAQEQCDQQRRTLDADTAL